MLKHFSLSRSKGLRPFISFRNISHSSPIQINKFKIPSQLSPDEKKVVEGMLRVNQAGELGANWIYKGQYEVFKRDPKLGPLIQEMWEQEKMHLTTFDQMIGENRVRPTMLYPVWEMAGYVLGVGTALMGKEAAMACTEAVETVIGEHYNDQIRTLMAMEPKEELAPLRKTIREFRDDELEHLDTAVEHDAKNAPAYDLLSAVIEKGCKAAIWISTRV